MSEPRTRRHPAWRWRVRRVRLGAERQGLGDAGRHRRARERRRRRAATRWRSLQRRRRAAENLAGIYGHYVDKSRHDDVAGFVRARGHRGDPGARRFPRPGPPCADYAAAMRRATWVRASSLFQSHARATRRPCVGAGRRYGARALAAVRDVRDRERERLMGRRLSTRTCS